MSNTTSSFRLTLSHNWQFVGILLLAVMTIIACSAWFAAYSQSQLTRSILRQAEILTTTLSEIRTLYTQEIISVASKRGILITHDYANQDNALPLPATLSMMLGNRIGALSGGEKSQLYSPYPFPWRKQGGLTDNFKQQAWEALSRQPEQVFYRFEQSGDQKILRYATADRMRKDCISCHNTHPKSPKKGWRVGDVRGILEVTVPAGDIAVTSNNTFYTGAAFISLILISSFSVVAVILKKLRRHYVELERANQKLDQLATYDSLTGLYNRRMLSERVKHSAALSERHGISFTLLYFDLDDFKKINDSCGHDVGDILLQQVAGRVGGLIRENDMLARMGGDEFIMLAEGAGDTSQVTVLANNIINSFKDEFYIANHSFRVSCSIGIAIYPSGGSTPEELIKHADLAMYQAKDEGRNCYKFYSEQMNALASRRLEIESDIRHALKCDEFSIHYQPKIDLNQGVVTGAEALIRWEHPEKGQIPPSSFISVAEKSDLIIEIDRWVREQVVKQLVAWKETIFQGLKISVNVSGKEFMRGEVVQHLLDLFFIYDIDQKLLELEITENTLLENDERSIMESRLIRNMDVGFAIDDFGTGYCSLGYLKYYPLDVLKIDKSFVDNVASDRRDGSIAKMIIAMAHNLNMSVVAEGVEVAEQKEFLKENGCDVIQGFYYCRPLAIEDFETFVRSFDAGKY